MLFRSSGLTKRQIRNIKSKAKWELANALRSKEKFGNNIRVANYRGAYVSNARAYGFYKKHKAGRPPFFSKLSKKFRP